MAQNSFQDIQQGAIAMIKAIQDETTKLDNSIVKLDEHARAFFASGSNAPKELENKVKELEKTVTKLNTALNQQTQNTTQLNQARQNLNRSSAQETQQIQSKIPSLRQLTKAQNSLVSSYDKLIAKRNQAKKDLRDLIASEKASTAEIKRAQKAFDSYQRRVNQANKATSNFKNTSLGGLVKGFRNLAGAFGLAGAAYMFVDLAKKTFNLTKTMQGLNYALQTVTKSEADLARTKQFITKISEQYGLELETTTERYTKFLVAAQQSNVSMADTEKIYDSVSKAAGVLGLKTHELEGVYLALEQMLSKGKVTTEELRRQLGERLPGAFGIMANAIGVSVEKLDDMLKKGEVLSADALPKFADALEKAYGIESVEKIDTIQAAQNRLTNTWVEFIDKFSKDGGVVSGFFIGIIGLATNALEIVLNFFESILTAAEKVSDSIKDAFKSDATREEEAAQKRLQTELEKTKAAYDAITDPIQKLSIAFKNLEINERNLQRVMDAHEGILSKIYLLEQKRDKLIVAGGISKQTEAINKQIAALKKSLPSYEREVKLYEEKIKLIESIIAAIESETGVTLDSLNSRREYKDVLADIAEAQKRLQSSTKEEAKAILDQIDVLNKEKEAWERTHKAKKEAKEQPFQDPSSLKSMQETISKLKDMQSRVEFGSIAYGTLGDQIKLLETIYDTLTKDLDKTNDKLKKQNDLLQENIQKWSEAQNEINNAILETQKNLREGFVTDFLGDIGFDFLSDIFTQFDELKDLVDSGLITWEDYFLGISELAQETFNFLNKNQEAYYDNQLDRLKEEKEWSIQFAGESTSAREEIERQYEEKRREILRRKAQAEKQTAIFNAIIDTAQAVVAALAVGPPQGFIFAALAGALGAAQIAMISSTPVPEYFRGTMNADEGWALVDEKNPEVHTDAQGKVKSMGQDKPNYRWMARGDKVYTSHEEYFNKELKHLLNTNDIEYSSMIDMMPNVIIENKSNNRDIVRELKDLGNIVRDKQEIDLTIDKNGFYVGDRKNRARTERMNNIIRLKRKEV